MPVTIMNDQREVLFQDDTFYEAEQFMNAELSDQTHKMDFRFGTAEFREMHFDGFIVGYGTALVRQNLQVENTERFKRIGMHFMLKGEVTAQINGAKHKLTTSSYQHNIVFNPGMGEHIRIAVQPEMKLFGLSFVKEKFIQLAANNGPVLDRYAENVANDKPVYMQHAHHITPRMMQVIEEVHNCHFTGGLKKLFLQSKAIELLALQCEQTELESRRSAEPQRISHSDEEKIHHARDLLLLHAREPLSLSELARKTGLNEFKLKSGFKKLFDTTVFGYLSDHRLGQAKAMMREGKLSFTEIADELGYSSLQHFSLAFRKKFGMSPREVKKWL